MPESMFMKGLIGLNAKLTSLGLCWLSLSFAFTTCFNETTFSQFREATTVLKNSTTCFQPEMV